MKSGPTSAVTSARMGPIGRPSRVVCTPSPPQAADRPEVRRAAEATGTICADSYRHDFPRIHDVVRIERTLDGGHGRERGASQLACEVFHLALPDAVLAGARAVHGECALDQPLA